MPRTKKKRVVQTRINSDQTYQNRYSSPNVQINSDYTEPNNNYMDGSGNTVSVASGTEMDLKLELAKPRIEIIDKLLATDSEKINYLASNASEAYLSDFSQKIDPKTETLMPESENTHKSRSEPQKICDELELEVIDKLLATNLEKTNYLATNTSVAHRSDFLQEIDPQTETLMPKSQDIHKSKNEMQKIFDELDVLTEAHINPGFETNKTSTGQVETNSLLEIINSKAQSVPQARSDKSKEPLKSTEVVIDNNTTTRDMPSNNTLEITSISERLNSENDLSCVDYDVPLKKPMSPEPMVLNNNPKCTNKDMSLTAKAKIDFLLRIVEPRATGRQSKPPESQEKLKEIRVDDTPSTMIEDPLSDDWMDVCSISDTEDHLPSRSVPMQEKKIIEPKLVKSSQDSESNMTYAQEIISTLKPTAKFVRKLRGRPSKKVKKPEEFFTEGNAISESTVSSNDRLEIQAKPEKLRQRKPWVRKPKNTQQKISVKSNSKETNSSPEYRTENAPAIIEMKTNSTSEMPKLKTIGRKRGRRAKKLKMPELTKINVTPRCEIEDISTTPQVQTDSIPDVTKPRVKRGRKPRTKKPKPLTQLETIYQVEMNPECETNATVLASKMETHVTSEILKQKRTRKTHCKTKLSQRLVMKSDAVETTINSIVTPNQTYSTALDNNKVATSTPMKKKPEIKSSVKRCRTKLSNKLGNSKTIEINNNPASESEFLFSQSSLRNDTLSDTLKVEDCSEKKSQELESKINSVVHNWRRNDHIDTMNNLLPKSHTLHNAIPETVKAKYPFFEKIYQPIVLLKNIAHSDILSPEQRERVLQTKQYTKILTVKNAADSSITRVIKQSMSVDVIDKASPESQKRKKKETVDCASSISASQDEHSIPKRGRIRTRKRKPKSKVLEVKSSDEMYKSKLVMRNSETNSNRNRNEIDALSSVENEQNNFYKCSQTTAISLEQSKSAQCYDFGKKSTELNILPDKDIQIWPLSETMESTIPLDLSIRNSDNPLSIQSDCPKSNDFLKEISSQTKEQQSQNNNLRNAGFGSTILDVIDLSTSFTKINATSNPMVSETPSKPRGNIDVCCNSILRKLLLHKPSKFIKKTVSSTTTTTFKRATKQVKKTPNRIVSVEPKKSPSDETYILKVLLPAKHYSNKRRSASEKSDTVVEQRNMTPIKANTEFHAPSNTTEYQTSQSITYLTPEQKSSEIDLITTEYRTTADRVGMKGEDINNISTHEPALERSIARPKVTTVRSLPKIISDELLPNVTIPIPFLNWNKSSTPCRVATEMKHKSSFEIRGDQHRASQEFTIHQQSTHPSTVNVSQSQSTVNFRYQPFASTSTSNVNIVTNTVNNSQEIKNLHGERDNKKVLKRIETTEENRCSVVDQNFDSTELWKICPELEDYFSHDDVVNNNNDKKLSKFDATNIVKNNIEDSGPHRILTKSESQINTDDSTIPFSNNIPRVPENANNLEDRFKGVGAVNVDYNEIGEESSESIAPRNESSSKKRPVIANLTTANLRNFNNIFKHSQGEFDWSAESCQYYVSCGDVLKHIDKPVSNIGIETSCGATESTLERYEEFSQAVSKKRKRKWLEEERITTFTQTKEKRVKLNRNRWSVDGQGFENVINFPRLTSVIEPSNLNNIEISNSVENVPVLKKTGCQEIVRTETKHEASAAAEKIEVAQSNHNDQKLEQNILDRTKSNKMKKIETPITVPVSTAISKTLECEFGNDNFLRHGLDIIQPPPVENDNSNSSIDKNGNLTSSSTSSSSSSPQSSKSMSNNDESIHSRISKSKHKKKNIPQPPEHQCRENENTDDEVDRDYISLFAESTFTSFDQPSVSDDCNLYSPLESVKASEERFQDMTDIGTYYDRNLQECNEAYANCIQEDENMRNVSKGISDASINNNRDEIIPQQLELNSNHEYSSQLTMQCFKRDLHPLASNLQRQNRLSVTNLSERLGERRRRTNIFSTYTNGIFRGHCFNKLKRGSCHRRPCQYYHILHEGLHNLGQKSPSIIIEVMEYAIYNGYNYFIQYIYPSVIEKMDYLNITDLFSKLCNNGLMDADYLVKATISAVIQTGMNLRKFVTDVVDLLDESAATVADSILRTIDSEIKPGTYWDTCRKLLITMKPSSTSIARLISECVQKKDKLQIQDVYQNFVRRLTPEQLSGININLKGQFDLLLEEIDLFPKYKCPSQSMVYENIHLADKFFEINIARDNCKEKNITPTILSPDNTVHRNYENLLAISSTSKQFGSHKFKPKESPSLGQQTPMKNQDTRSYSTASNHSFLYQRRNAISSEVKQTPDLNDQTTKYSPSKANSSWNSLRLHRIGNLNPPQSVFRDRHWRLHLDMNNLNEALKHSEYSLALKILNKYSEMNKTLFTTACYNMLRKNVMASAHHVENMIKLSVPMEVNKLLNETLANLGMYLMIELCNANAWVLAYSLFKTLQYSAILTENITAFALISAEICLANRRPLKAFTIMKQNNMLCTSRSKLNVVSVPNDEYVRVMIVNLLLDVLCQEYPDRALYIFTYLLADQPRIYHPVDLTAHVDNLVTGILNGKCTDLICNVGRLIIENNFMLKNSVFRSLIINTYDNDIDLCRQLYRYSTWLGVYPIIKLTLPLHVLIKTNWTKEEMYLVIVDFVEKLSRDIGPAIDHIGPNQFAIHLVFELAPFKEQLLENDVQVSNKDELKMSKEFMKNVLQERFNPPLKTIIAEKERFMKLQSHSVVNYLKSMSAQ